MNVSFDLSAQLISQRQHLLKQIVYFPPRQYGAKQQKNT